MIIKDRQLSGHFRSQEFRCRCRRKDCDAHPMQVGFIDKLERLRVLWGKPLRITSGQRCVFWNAAVGGAPHSQHTLGNAADLALDDPSDGVKLEALAEKVGLNGVGIGQTFIHLDDREHMARWTYDH